VKKKRFSVEQIVSVLKEAELGTPVADLIRKVGVSEQTFYRWKKVYGGLEPSQARKLKQLEEENAKLKRLVADLSLDKIMLQDVLKKSGEAFGTPGHDRVHADALCGKRAASMRGGNVHARELPLPQLPRSAYRIACADPGDRARARALRLPASACAA
jgi:putative transposase